MLVGHSILENQRRPLEALVILWLKAIIVKTNDDDEDEIKHLRLPTTIVLHIYA